MMMKDGSLMSAAPVTAPKGQQVLNGQAPTPPPAMAAAPQRLRRRPLWVVVAVALVAAGALLGVLLWQASTTTVEVVAVRADVARGELITAADVGTVRVSADPALQTVPAAEVVSVVGKRAAVDLSEGALLTPAQLAVSVVPEAGESVVGVPIAPGLMPAEGLLAGDRVRLVQTPAAQADVPAVPQVIDAVVHSVSAVGADGQTVVVDVVVPASKAPEVAARAGTGRVAIVLDSRER